MTRSHTPWFTLLATIVLLVALVAIPATATAAQPQMPGAAGSGASSFGRAGGGSRPALARLPVAFEANQGQFDARAQFVARVQGDQSRDTAFFFTPGGVAVVLSRNSDQLAFKVGFLDASPDSRMEGQDLLPGRVNYFLGSDPAHWRRNVPAYGSILYHDIYPHTDLRYREAGGHLKYDFVLRPGARVEAIALAYDGVEDLRLNDGGQLEILTAWGTLVEEAPQAWQEEPGGYRAPVAVRYALGPDASGPGARVGFQVGAYDPARTLVIDPALRYSTFVGGSGTETAQDIVLDGAGNALVTGATSSLNFPTTTGIYSETHSGGDDVYVLKLAADGGSLLFSTFLGGAGDETGYGLDLNSSGNIVVAGATASADFPTTSGAHSTKYNGGASDAFVTTLSANGASLIFSTFLGGDDEDIAYALDIASDHPEDQPIVTGVTRSKDFPTTSGVYERDHSGASDVFVTRVLVDATFLRYSTLIGGADQDAGQALAADDDGRVLVTGYTYSTDFPTTSGVLDRILNGGQDAFVLRLSSKASSLRFSTYLGGAGNESGQGIALDMHSRPVITGKTASPDFPTSTGAFDVSHNGGEDVFVSKLDVDGKVLNFSTFIGGSSADSGTAVVVDGIGNPIVAGYSRSLDFPTSDGAYDPAHDGEADAVLLKLGASGEALMYATFAGGSLLDEAHGLALFPGGDAIIAGRTQSSGFPTTDGAYDRGYNGTQDAFVLRLDGLGSLTAGIIDVAVAQSSDDAEELDETGAVDLDNDELRLVHRGGIQTVGLRFKDITIPQNSTILKAAIEFTADEIRDETTTLTFHGQDIAAAPTFAISAGDISTRTTTTASADWDPVQAWRDVGEPYQTPDLSAAVQEIVDRGDWSSGNPLAFIITGAGRRIAVSYDGATGAGDETLAPRLQVTYGDPCYHLDISASPGGSGSVTADPEPNCRGKLYTAGSQVQLTAIPAEGYTLANWSGDASGSVNPTTLIMDDDKAVTANFKTATCYTLTTGVDPAASGSVSASPAPNCGIGKYVAGTQVQLTASPEATYAFASWSGAATGSANPATVTVDADRTVIAHFNQPACYSLATAVKPSGSGMVSASPAPNCGADEYVENTEVYVTASPATDHVFADWSGDATGNANPAVVTMTSAKSVTANFQRETCYSLTTEASPPGSGVISAVPAPNCGGGKYVSGTQVQLTAVPATDHVLLGWAGDASGTDNPASLTVNGDKSVTARFAQETCYNLAVDASPPGSGTVLREPPPNCGGGKYVAGTEVKLTASPGAGFAFDRWSGDVAGSANPETTLVDADKLVAAHFVWPNQIYLPFAFWNGH